MYHIVKRTSFVLLLYVVVILSSGCSQGGHNVLPDTLNSKKETPVTTEVTTPPKIKEVSINEAWGNIPIIHKIYPLKPRSFEFISEEGDLLYIEDSASSEKPDCTLFIENIKTSSKEIVKHVKYPIQMYDGKSNADWVVWLEVVGDALNPEKQEIHSYNRKTKTEKVVFKPPLDKRSNSPLSDLKGNEFLIDVLLQPPSSTESAVISSRKYSLITGEYEEIAKQFAFPKWGTKGYIGLAQDKEEEKKGYSIVSKLEDGIMKPLFPKGAMIYDCATDGEAVICTAQRFKTDNIANEAMERNLWLYENGTETVIKSLEKGNPEGCAYPKLTKRIAVYRFNMKPCVYDRKLNKIVNLTSDTTINEKESFFYANDKYLFWTISSKKETDVNIIEMNKLP